MKKILLGIALASVIVTSSVVVFYVTDRQDPEILTHYPFKYNVFSGTVELEMTATDNSGKVIPIIIIDGEKVSTSGSYDWNTTVYADGSTHELVFKAKDKRGNSVEKTILVAVDNYIDSPPSDVFKAMSFNIWESGESVLGFNGITRPAGDWLKVMKEENADIAILVETGTLDDGDSNKLKDAMAKLTGYFYYEAPYEGYAEQDIPARTDGEAIISRYPILDFHQIKEYKLDDGSIHHYHHDFCDAVVNISGTVTHIIGYHGKCCSPSPSCNTTWMRENETEGIINYLDKFGSVPVMFMGDFNSHSPDDVGDLAPLGWLGDGPLRMLLYPEDPTYGKYSSKYHNFTDVFRTLNPTAFGPTYGAWDEQYWGRIDYIIVNQHWADKMINSTTGDTYSANMSADHYSVDCFFSLDENYSYFDSLNHKEDKIIAISDCNSNSLPESFNRQYIIIGLKRKKALKV